MAEYFTSCEDKDEIIEEVRALLQNDGHTIVGTIRDDVRLETYDKAQKRRVSACGVPGTDGNVIIHSTR